MFQPGDIVWIELADSAGHEQAGRRPAVVVSVKDYNANSSLVLICPVTSNDKPWPFKIRLEGELNGIEGYVLADQIRGIDPAAHFAQPVGAVSASCLERIQALVAVLIGLQPTP